jgi:protein-S-isoprenylcysteine O-methyltransferase Ste14
VLVAGLVVCVLLSVVLPTVRLRLRTGKRAIAVMTSSDPIRRFADASLLFVEASWVAWVFGYAIAGPERLSVARASDAFAGVGWLMVGAGLVLSVVAQRQMDASFRIGIDDERTALVTRGLFGVVRNPIFTGVLLMFGGLAVITPSPWSAMGIVLTFAVIRLQALLEERHLLSHHGDAYLAYASRVGRFVPRIGRLSPQIEIRPPLERSS